MPAAPLDAGDEVREGDPSITPSRKTIPGGEDWLDLSLYVNHFDVKNLSARLDAAQEAAIAGSYADSQVQLGDTRFIVHATGARLGDAMKGLRLRWRLQAENGVVLLVGSREKAHHTQPNMAIKASSMVLMQYGIESVWGMVQYWVEKLGADLVGNKVSRVDVCVDLVDVPLTEFVEAYRAGWLVSPVRRRTEHGIGVRHGDHSFGSEPTGFSVISADKSLRVYNKLEESKNQPDKLALLIANRWGYLPKHATRVEFQLRRDGLRRYKVDDIQSWLSKRAAICEALTTEAFRLVIGPIDPNHADRSPLQPVWIKSREAFAEWCGAVTDADLTPLRCLPSSTDHLVKSAIGYLVAVFARRRTRVEDNDDFLFACDAALANAINGRDMAAEVAHKAIKLGIG